MTVKSCESYAMWHSVSRFESCCIYQIRSVGVWVWSRSQSSEGSVSLPAWFSAMIASAVSRMFPQWSDDSLSSSSSTQSSNMLSGVAIIVRASSCVVRLEQSSALSSRHSNASSILSSSDMASSVHSSSSQISSVSQSLSDVQSSPSVAATVENENKIRNRVRNATLFFMLV
mgnify:CR=1 FL=1